jgi:SAM-dependent methyltransferase
MTDIREKNLYLNDAQFYDLDNRDVTKVDIPFYLKYAEQIKGSILELACGTGRITIPLAKAGHEIWAAELSETMIRQFKAKLKELPQETAGKVHLLQADMSNFSLGQKFPLIILPCRSFQLLLEGPLEKACLKNIHRHLAEKGTFIIDVGNFIGNKDKEKEWQSEKEIFDWENTDPRTGFKIRRMHINKEIDTGKQIIYPRKIYYITKHDGSIETVCKRSPWKYFYEEQIKELLTAADFKIIAEMGTYDGKPFAEGSDFIFVCQKA